MKGKRIFTFEEIEEIKKLIKEKESASPDLQKAIRNKIRRIKFYWTDFDFPGKYTLENFEQLLKNRIIEIGDTRIDHAIAQDVLQLSTKTVELKSVNENRKESLDPWVGESPKVLILGSLLGDVSLVRQEYYSNTSRNSFWRIMRNLFPGQEGSNKQFITSNHIALWDCVKSGIRLSNLEGNIDENSIIPNDLVAFLHKYPTIKAIVLNGKGDTVKIFNKYFLFKTTCEVLVLDSTSNLNTLPFEEKLKRWSVVKELVNSI